MRRGLRRLQQRAGTLARARTALNHRPVLDVEGLEAGRPGDRPVQVERDLYVLDAVAIGDPPSHYSITFAPASAVQAWRLPFFVVTYNADVYRVARRLVDDRTARVTVTCHSGQRDDGLWCQLLDELVVEARP